MYVRERAKVGIIGWIVRDPNKKDKLEFWPSVYDPCANRVASLFVKANAAHNLSKFV